MSEIQVTNEKTGATFTGTVGESANGARETAWVLATFQVAGAVPLTVQGRTWGMNENPRCALANYNNWRGAHGQLRAYVSRNKLLTNQGGLVVVSLPGKLHVTGYEDGIDVTLEQKVASGRDVGLAVNAMADDLKRMIVRYGFASWPKPPEASNEGEVPEVIDF